MSVATMAAEGHQRSPPLHCIEPTRPNDPLTMPGAGIHRPVPGGWRLRMPERLDEEELVGWRVGHDAGLSARRADDRRTDRGPRRLAACRT
jgi:hypothetical protein